MRYCKKCNREISNKIRGSYCFIHKSLAELFKATRERRITKVARELKIAEPTRDHLTGGKKLPLS